MGPAELQLPKKKFKKTLFETGFQWFLRDLTFSLKLADNQYTGILKNEIKIQKVLDDKKKISLDHSYIYMYINEVANSVMLQLYLRHD